jgi:hypothetical protein
MEKLASCCGFRKVKAGQAWSEYRDYVRRLARKQDTLSESQRDRMAKLKGIATSERQAFHDHCADESLEHK